jgi:hypothetical protein
LTLGLHRIRGKNNTGLITQENIRVYFREAMQRKTPPSWLSVEMQIPSSIEHPGVNMPDLCRVLGDEAV